MNRNMIDRSSKSQILFLLFLTLSTFSISQKLDSVNFLIDGKSFTSYYAKPSKITAETKTILIVHEWWGLNEYPKSRALQIAKEGNIAFCINMYGTNVLADNPKDAQTLAGPFYADPAMAYNRFKSGYLEALKIEGVDRSRMAAIGYCFGGSMVLNAAKMGLPIDAVVSFHGGLAGIPVEKDKLTAAVLVCNGAADQFVPEKDITELQKQMTEAGEDYTFINYKESTHAFTNPGSTAVGQKFNIPISYNEKADKKSWKDFNKFIDKKVK